MNDPTIDKLYLNKTFLFVDDELAVCSAVKRMARIYGVNVQTANSASVALSLIEHNPDQYFLILTDEIMPGMSGTELLTLVGGTWPHIRRALISAVDDAEVLQKGYEEAKIFRYLSKPMTDAVIQQLVEDTCADVLSEKRSREETVNSRLSILNGAIKQGFDQPEQYANFESFSLEYLAGCRNTWNQANLYQVETSVQDSHIYENYLTQRCCLSVEKIKKRMDNLHKIQAPEFRLSSSLRQFGVRGLRKADRFIEGDETLFVAMFATLKDYYLILGLSMQKMVIPHDTHLEIQLGGRFTYNDFFNPLLSSVERGVEIVCLQLELLMLAKLFGADTKMDFRDKFSLNIMV